MKVFLTGATGYFGQRLTGGLIRAGHEVTALARSRERCGPIEALGARVVLGDVVEFDRAEVNLSRFDACIHSAALVATRARDRGEFDRVNVDGVANVARACLAAGVARFVYTSSFMALGPSRGGPLDETAEHAPDDFHNDYERTKYLGYMEFRRAREWGLPGVALFPCVIYGPGALTSGNLTASIIADIVMGRMPGILGDGSRAWTYSYVEDVVAGHVQALTRGRAGQGYILGGESVTMGEFIGMVAEAAGVRPPTRHIPYGVAKAGALFEEIRARLTGREPKLTREVVEVYKHSWAYSSEKAEKELGYRITPLKAGLAETVAWVKSAIEEGKIT